jgi:hypothetical protein
MEYAKMDVADFELRIFGNEPLNFGVYWYKKGFYGRKSFFYHPWRSGESKSMLTN